MSYLFDLGASRGGKTHLTSHLVLNWSSYFEQPKLDKITLFYKAKQPLFDSWDQLLSSETQLVKHLGDIKGEQLSVEELASPNPEGHSLVVIDDQLTGLIRARTGSSLFEEFSKLILVNSHHHQVS